MPDWGGDVMPMVVACAAYEDGRRIADLDIENCGAIEPRDGRFVWIGLHEPNEELLRKVQDAFGLHELAIEDAHRPHQRPKLDVYGDALFLILRTAQLTEGRILYGETHVFAGKGYVISIRHGASSSYGEVRARCERDPRLLRLGEAYVLHAIMDFVADNYFPIVDAVAQELATIEEHIFAKSSRRAEIERLFNLRCELRTFRRTVSPMLEVCHRFMRPDLPLVAPEIRPYFRDVADHVMMVNEAIDGVREGLAAAFETSLLLASANQSEVVRKLASWAAILAVPTAVAGIYGMNFDNMPELKFEYGYYLVVGTLAAVCAGLFLWFKRIGWL